MTSMPLQSSTNLPCYDRFQSYEWNYEHAPAPREMEVPVVPGDWRFCGLPVRSPLGIPAGPLLNGRWCMYYASLGFDVLTYKTVRSSARPCYPLPNLQPVRCSQLDGGEADLPVSKQMQGSWAVSFGMPSKSPSAWRADITQTRRSLPEGKLLSVSVVGTMQDGWTIDDLAADYAPARSGQSIAALIASRRISLARTSPPATDSSINSRPQQELSPTPFVKRSAMCPISPKSAMSTRKPTQQPCWIRSARSLTVWR